MKIEAGKNYRTRDGSQARIYAVNCGGEVDNQAHGAVFYRDIWSPRNWKSDGGYLPPGCGIDSHDLVSEWFDPKPRKLGWIYQTKNIASVYLNEENWKPEIDVHNWSRAPWLDQPEEK